MNLNIKKLQEHANALSHIHLRELLKDEKRNDFLTIKYENILMDFSHTKMNIDTVKLLQEYVCEEKIMQKINEMFNGVSLNSYYSS